MILQTIRLRMLAAALVPVSLVVVGIVIAFWVGRVSDLDQAHAQRNTLLVRQLAIASEYAVFSGNQAQLQSILVALQREPFVVGATIYDPTGRVLARAGEPPSVPFAALETPDYLAMQQAKSIDTLSVAIKAESVQLDDLFGIAEPKSDGAAKVLGYAVVDISRDGLYARERDLLIIALTLGSVGLLVGGFLAVQMGEGVVRPILRVSHSIERIGHGDFATRAPVERSDPLHELQDALNQLAGRLAWGREELEQRINAATLELRAKKEEAEEATVAKSRFLAAASHDLRQPTHALGMFIARLGQLPLDGQTAELVGNLEASVKAMQDLLDGLLDLSRLEAGAVQVSPAPVNLDMVFSALGVALQPMASVKHLRLRVRPTRYWGLTDPILLQRILMNLAHNALRYTERGTVLVACRKVLGGSHVRIEVRDSGIGISPEHQTQVFKEFFQVANPGRDRSYGLGLGLNIVERSAKLLGHELTVLSQVGCGTRISITLPLVPASPQMTQLVAPDASSFREAVGQHILVIEDDDFAREAMYELLNSWGYRVSAVASISQGYASLAQEGVPDIIVSDYRLGHGENGIDAIAGLRKAVGYDIAACLMSGDTDAELMQSATQTGLTLLHKPVRPAKLRSLLRRLLAGANPADFAASTGS